MVDTLGDVATTIANRDGGEGGNNPEQVAGRAVEGAAVAGVAIAGLAWLGAGKPPTPVQPASTAAVARASTRATLPCTPGEQVEQLRGAVVQLLEARRRAQLHAGALQDLKGSYVASGEATDFAAALEQRAEAAGQLEP